MYLRSTTWFATPNLLSIFQFTNYHFFFLSLFWHYFFFNYTPRSNAKRKIIMKIVWLLPPAPVKKCNLQQMAHGINLYIYLRKQTRTKKLSHTSTKNCKCSLPNKACCRSSLIWKHKEWFSLDPCFLCNPCSRDCKKSREIH